LFRESEDKSYPIALLSCHEGASISCIYIAYSPARRSRETALK